VRGLSQYWEDVRHYYSAFESDMRSGTSAVYFHEIPGGQYTNLREQARALGLERRWEQVERCYAQVNMLFGDIIKVTPSSKVVGDMALFMVSHGLSEEDVRNPDKAIAFPESVVSMFRGDIGIPPGGFPAELSRKILHGEQPLQGRPGESLPPADLEAARSEAEIAIGRTIDDQELASYLMYPKVFLEYARHYATYDDVSVIPTPVFFGGLRVGDETEVQTGRGRSLLFRLQGRSEPDEEGQCKLFFELNGEPRRVTVTKEGLARVEARPKIDERNPGHVGAPMPGTVSTVAVEPGQLVAKGDALLYLEAMKMETLLRAERDATVKQVLVKPGNTVAAKDLLIVLE
jgi:pyruvate carboxylase